MTATPPTIIASLSNTSDEPSWQEQLNTLISSPSELFDLLRLPSELLTAAEEATKLFPLRVPRPYLSRIKKADLNDPLLKQVLPLGLEQEVNNAFTNDPLGEKESNPVRGIIHKYHGRVLLVSSPQCAINCRYCFRRTFDYHNNTPSRREWLESLDYLVNDTSIEEVIFSGGDPFTLSDAQLRWLLEQISNIPHVKRIRFHTRLPIVVPSRVSEQLLNVLSALGQKVVVVVHCNHPQEIDEHVQHAFLKLRHVNITVLNQAVLLKSVNDSATTLIELNKQLFQCGVLPYYLHLMDKVTGTAHFQVPEVVAKKIHTELLAALPGYLVPKLVREERGAHSKTLVQ